MKKLILPVALVGVLLVGGCANRTAGLARAIQPSKEGYQVGQDEVALEFTNQNFQDALVVVDLPEGQTVRLGWVPGQHTKAWAVPLQVPGEITFHIQLQKATGAITGLATDNPHSVRFVARCDSQMYFTPGTARSLNIFQQSGDQNFCPGMAGGPI